MSVKIKVQKDYLLTEASVDSSTPIADLHAVMKDMKANGKMIVLYNGGAVQGINVEQRTKISDVKSEMVRELLEITTREMEVKTLTKK
jgi:chitinase